MGSYVNGTYVPTIGETGWGDELNDFLTRTAQEYVNVRLAPYAAIGDNTTDNLTAFTAAFAAVQAAGGGEVFVPPAANDYYISNNITVAVGANPFRLRGFNSVASRIRFAAGKGFVVGDNSALTHYFSFQDIGIRHLTADSTPLLDLNKGDQFTITGCAITGGAIDMEACITGRIIGNGLNTPVSAGQAVKLSNSDQVAIVANSFEDQAAASTHIIAVSGNRNVSIVANTFSTNSKVLEIGTGPNTEYAIVGNTAFNVTHGFDLDAGGAGLTRSVVVGNSLRGTGSGGGFGIIVSSANTDLAITGNLVTNFPGALLTGTPGANVEIIGNPGIVDLRQRVDVIATASLPAAGAAEDGRIVIENVGAGDRNLIIYAGGQRFRIDGGANV